MFTHTESSALEQAFRFPSSGADLYGVLHQPQTPRGGVMLCTADGEERAWTHRAYVQLARDLAAKGQVVLRFDYSGHGESSGRYEDATVESRLADIAAAIDVLQKRGVASPVLVGLRLGAAFALEAAARNSGIDALVLWEPVFDIDGYVRNLLRVNLATQMVIHKQVVRNSEQLMKDLAAGERVSINGYNLAGRFVDEVGLLRPAERLATFQGAALIVNTPAGRLPDSRAQVVRQQFPPFWKEPKNDMTLPFAAIATVSQWIHERTEL